MQIPPMQTPILSQNPQKHSNSDCPKHSRFFCTTLWRISHLCIWGTTVGVGCHELGHPWLMLLEGTLDPRVWLAGRPTGRGTHSYGFNSRSCPKMKEGANRNPLPQEVITQARHYNQGPLGPALGLAVLYLAHLMFSEPMNSKAFRLLLITPEAWAHLLPVGHTLFLVPASP